METTPVRLLTKRECERGMSFSFAFVAFSLLWILARPLLRLQLSMPLCVLFGISGACHLLLAVHWIGIYRRVAGGEEIATGPKNLNDFPPLLSKPLIGFADFCVALLTIFAVLVTTLSVLALMVHVPGSLHGLPVLWAVNGALVWFTLRCRRRLAVSRTAEKPVFATPAENVTAPELDETNPMLEATRPHWWTDEQVREALKVENRR